MTFAWSATFTVGAATAHLKGDKIILPHTALEAIIQAHAAAPPPPPPLPDPSYDPTSWDHPPPQQTLDSNGFRKPQELPSPLTFQIRNPANRLLTHSGVKEFSAEDGQVRIPAWMMESLSLAVGDQVMVKFTALPKGTWAKFRPITADYMEILDFRALLESALRSNYTTLTKGEVLKVHQGAKEFGFVVEELKPEPGEAVCITDTDLETLKIGSESQGRIIMETYQRWTVDIPNRASGVQIVVEPREPGDVDVVVSTRSPVSLHDHIWANFESLGPRSILIPAADPDYATQQDSNVLHIGVYGRSPSTASSDSSSNSAGEVDYTIIVRYQDGEDTSLETGAATKSIPSAATDIPNKNAAGYQECTNCGSWIPERTIMLHSNFCFRNNVKCDRCGDVMRKEELENHFHCDHCEKHGHVSERKKHMEVYHGWYQCTCETYETPSLPELARHRRTICPERFIICRYCHILVQQGAPASNARDLIRGLCSHESYCGDRTIQCQKCTQMVSLKDVQVHAQHHEYQRQNQTAPLLCSNQNCVRTKSTNVLGLCQLCFGPYWVPTEDPKHQKLVQRLARKYHSQLMSGCGNSWCRNQHCATFRGREMDATSAATEMMGILKEAKIGSAEGGQTWLCVDEGTTRKKVMAELLFEDMKGVYAMEWCVKALEAEKTDLEAAVQWLNLQAPRKRK
ncbi:hypothetical protein BGZ70_000805 [Mortierella alpina]|uniref:Ubiquitin-protein ligase E3A N-terminal zinc-binding domain-containing protein n=1 Tax=Mortierella alpina TaxID=64518 RepID=A0A9P6IX93_MORAP|nr:hypothetical protein BGZ70_000805 [Mortierella alpina]